MKTVMDEARTGYKKGKVNNKFQQFADHYGFKVRPCKAGRPNTKAKDFLLELPTEQIRND